MGDYYRAAGLSFIIQCLGFRVGLSAAPAGPYSCACSRPPKLYTPDTRVEFVMGYFSPVQSKIIFSSWL